MTNPYDPKQPLYQGQPVQGQAPASPLSGLHLLEGVGNLATAIGYFFAGGGKDDDDEADEQAPKPRRFRPRVFGAGASPRAGKGSCCRRPVGGK